MNDRIMPTPRNPFTEAHKAELEENAKTIAQADRKRTTGTSLDDAGQPSGPGKDSSAKDKTG